RGAVPHREPADDVEVRKARHTHLLLLMCPLRPVRPSDLLFFHHRPVFRIVVRTTCMSFVRCKSSQTPDRIRGTDREAITVSPWQLDRTFHSTSGEVRWALLGGEPGPDTAPPVVLLHGTPFSSYVWRGVARALAVRHAVHVWDMP